MRLGRCIGLLVLLLILSLGDIVFASTDNKSNRVVILVIDRLSLDDLTTIDTPNLNQLIQNGAVGLMNTNTRGGRNPENTYSTLGAGSRILASNVGKLGYNTDEILNKQTASEMFKQRTGIQVSPQEVIHLGIAQIHRLNENVPYPARPGALGETLQRNNIRTAVLGNSDNQEEELRQIVSFVMNESGRVDLGNVSKDLLVKDPSFLGGYRTDYDRLLQEFRQVTNNAQFIVIDLGDLSRLEKNWQDAFDTVFKNQRLTTLNRIDYFLGQLLPNINLSDDLLLILSPTPSYAAQKNSNYLTPVIAAGSDIKPGLLSSPTTKREGIVVISDIAPTVLEAFKLNIPLDMNGKSFNVVSSTKTINGNNSLEALNNLNNQLVLTYNARNPLLRGYVFLQIIILLISLYCIFRNNFQYSKYLKPFLLAIMIVPLVYLLLPLLPQPSLAVLTTELIGLTLLLTTLTILLQKRLDPFVIICIVTAIIILADLILGQSLQKSSILGYDPILGARFYGIGNEYMGVLIGSSIIAATALLTKFPSWRKPLLVLIALFFLTTIYTIASPNLGTNVGGTIASTSAFLVTYLLLIEVKIKPKTILLSIGMVLLVVLSFIIYDLRRAPDLQSHIGRTANLILNNGIVEIVNIISRKLEVNIRLIKSTIWSRIFIVSLGSFALLFYRPFGIMQSIKDKYPYLYKGFAGVITGSIVAFIVNDSGVVAAATTMIFAAPPLIYVIIQEKKL